LLENWAILLSPLFSLFTFCCFVFSSLESAISPSLFLCFFFFFELFKMALSFSLCSDQLTPVILELFLSLPLVLQNFCKDEFVRVNVFNRNVGGGGGFIGRLLHISSSKQWLSSLYKLLQPHKRSQQHLAFFWGLQILLSLLRQYSPSCFGNGLFFRHEKPHLYNIWPDVT